MWGKRNSVLTSATAMDISVMGSRKLKFSSAVLCGFATPGCSLEGLWILLQGSLTTLCLLLLNS